MSRLRLKAILVLGWVLVGVPVGLALRSDPQPSQDRFPASIPRPTYEPGPPIVATEGK